ncbi:nuclear transport factor 2 family protein [Nocardia shimofusensis]|uniref:nuclear transport factor 2 family protein n=1 Tax=Nocardia shimofusensis TaxID=228596 RepID=UPI00082EB373|nr:nuclear transport factor 2 family protein [Nocardia shimofusensis]
MHRPTRSLRAGIATAVAVVALAAGLVGCSDDESTDTAATSSAVATSAASATTGPASAATGEEGHSHEAPAPDELQATLDRFADPAEPATEKTGLVVDGDKRLANIEAMNAALGGYGALTFTVTDVTVEGETATAQVVITSPHGPAPAMPLTWQHEDDSWKISDGSACTLLGFAQAPCLS